jgi:hypothetical protein
MRLAPGKYNWICEKTETANHLLKLFWQTIFKSSAMSYFRIASIAILLVSTLSLKAQKANHKAHKKASKAEHEAVDDLDDASKKMLLAHCAEYDSAILVCSRGGYGDYPVMKGFGYSKDQVYQLLVQGTFIKSGFQIDSTNRIEIKPMIKAMRMRKIKISELMDLNSDSLYSKTTLCCDIAFHTIRLFKGKHYILKTHQSGAAPNTDDAKIFDATITELYNFLNQAKQ